MMSEGSEPVVIIVDDDALIRDALCMVLEAQGWRCLQAGNGAAGLELLRGLDTPPNLILLDLTMPVMTGWEFRRVQMADACLAAIPTFILTAVGDVRAASLDLDPERILRKPLDLGRLLEVARQHASAQRPSPGRAATVRRHI